MAIMRYQIRDRVRWMMKRDGQKYVDGLLPFCAEKNLERLDFTEKVPNTFKNCVFSLRQWKFSSAEENTFKETPLSVTNK